MPTPSLLIVPARFKSGRLYSQIPTANGDFNVTRATTATRFGPDGLIASVASGIPRLDYFASGGVVGCPALLVEPSAQNLAKYSEQFNTVTSGWTPTNLQTITGNTNATLDPAGGNTADLIVATTGTIEHYLSNSANNYPSFVSGTAYTFSIFAKATSTASGFVQILFGDIGFTPSSPYANFQLSGNGAITTGTYSAATIQPFGNGWYRCSITATAAGNGNGGNWISPLLASGTTRGGSFTGNGVDGVYLWGAQLETGSVATSYIPTTTGSVTRNADVISVSGAVSGSIGQTEGTLYVEFTGLHDQNTEIIAIRANTALDNIAYIGCGNGLIYTGVYANSSYRFQGTIARTIPNNTFKVALAYKSGDFGFFINGQNSASGTLTYSPLSSFTQVVFSEALFLGKRPIKVLAAALYTTRLTDTELASLTAP